MLRSEAITIIKRGLGFRQTQDAAIIAALKEAQRDLELGQTLPNWLVQFDLELVVTTDVATATLPEGFLRWHEEYPLSYLDSDGELINVPRKNYGEATEAYGDVEDSEFPAVFVQRNKTTIELIPVPTTSFSMYFAAYIAADVLDSEIENLWLLNAPNYLVGVAGMKVAGDLRDKGALERFTKMAQMGNKGLLGDIIEDELVGRALIMGRNN